MVFRSSPAFVFPLLLAFCLTACGGGSAPQSVAVNEPNAPKINGNTATDGFNWFNFRREQAGLNKVARNDKLDKAAQAHSDYLKENRVVSHDEDPEKSGFTGVSPVNRIEAAGYVFGPDKNLQGEVLSRTTDELGENAAEDLIGAIYHRFVILEPMYKEAGAGAVTSSGGFTYFTVNFVANGFDGGIDPAKVVMYPFKGQQNVRASVSSDQEEPDPVPNADVVGYPVSVHANQQTTLTVETFQLTQQDTGNLVSARLLTMDTDSHTPESAAALIPLSPLASGKTYEAYFKGETTHYVEVDNVVSPVVTPVEHTWTFTVKP